MQNQDSGEYARLSLPSWQAPIAGAIVLTVFGVYLAAQMERPATVGWVGGFCLIGVAIGLLVALCDGPGPGTLVSRFLALISPVTAFLPIAGILFGGAAYLANRNHPGIYRTVSRIGIVLTALVSLVFAWLLSTEGA